MKNNKGVTLVELIIVIAIMAVVSGILALSLGSALSKPADECAQKLTNALKSARITTMGKLSCEITIKQASNGAEIWLEEKITNADGSTKVTNTKIGQKNVSVTYKIQGIATPYNLYDKSLVLSYKRETGGFNIPTGHSAYCEEIVIKKGNRTRTIKLSYLTGKVSVE